MLPRSLPDLELDVEVRVLSLSSLDLFLVTPHADFLMEAVTLNILPLSERRRGKVGVANIPGSLTKLCHISFLVDTLKADLKSLPLLCKYDIICFSQS